MRHKLFKIIGAIAVAILCLGGAAACGSSNPAAQRHLTALNKQITEKVNDVDGYPIELPTGFPGVRARYINAVTQHKENDVIRIGYYAGDKPLKLNDENISSGAKPFFTIQRLTVANKENARQLYNYTLLMDTLNDSTSHKEHIQLGKGIEGILNTEKVNDVHHAVVQWRQGAWKCCFYAKSDDPHTNVNAMSRALVDLARRYVDLIARTPHAQKLETELLVTASSNGRSVDGIDIIWLGKSGRAIYEAETSSQYVDEAILWSSSARLEKGGKKSKSPGFATTTFQKGQEARFFRFLKAL